MKGGKMQEKIETLGDVVECVRRKKSLYCPSTIHFSKPRPAAFMINLSGHMLFNMINYGLYVYQKQGKA